MLVLSTEISINASPERVWQILTDFSRYGEWNPFIRQIDGPFEVGARLRAELDQGGGKSMTIKPRLVAIEESKRFGWLGRLLVPGVFDGEHWYELEAVDGGVRFKHYEHFSGVLVPFLRGMLENKTRASFEAMNRALKSRAEESR